MRKKLGQLMLIGVSGHSLTVEEKKFIVDNNISGVILFARNVADPKQIRDLCAEIQALRFQMPDKAPLIIGIDMEGGRVHRLKPPFTIWPPVGQLGKIDNPSVTFHFANKMGIELKSVGINLDFAPCVDIFNNPQNTVIGDRSVGSDPELVAKHGSALVRGYIKSEMISCAKHFPGHGHTPVDSHEDLPVEDFDMKRLDDIELIPFKRAFKARVDMVMTAHMLFPKIDSQWPVTLSEIFLKKIVREHCRYKGIIITDDLDMKAMAKHYDKEMIPVRALQAGADMLLYCNEPDSPPRALDGLIGAVAQGQLDKATIEALHQKVLNFKKDKIPNPEPWPLSEALKVIGNPEHLKIASAVKAGNIPEGILNEPT